MADDFLAIETIGDEAILRALRALPEEAQNAIMDDVNEYAIHSLQAYPPQAHITRKQAYGKTFFSDSQRKFFFAALNDGRISVPYRRTQTLRRGWYVEGTGPSSFIVNQTAYADLMMGEGQSRMAKLGGWKKAVDVIQERIEKITSIAEAGVRKALRKLGL